jgi:hypothetical protein
VSADADNKSSTGATGSGVGGVSGTINDGNHLYEAWCSQHQSHPKDCWELHNQVALEKSAGSLSTDDNIALTKAHHLQLQERYAKTDDQDQA